MTLQFELSESAPDLYQWLEKFLGRGGMVIENSKRDAPFTNRLKDEKDKGKTAGVDCLSTVWLIKMV